MLALPGGHVDVGETLEENAIREIKEETNLDVINIEFVRMIEFIHDERFVNGTRHLISFGYRADLADENQEIILDGEGTSYEWLTPEEVFQDERVAKENRDVMKDFFIKKEKKKIFSKKCKDCDDNLREAEEYKSGWQRAQADYKNLQKEILDQRGEWARMSEQTILEEFIPVYDNFKKAFAMEHGEENSKWENWAKGVEYIMKQFGKILEDHSVVEIRTEGEMFNPELHEAAGEEESEEDAGRILREVDGGYKMKDKVIKVARVIVAK